MTKIEKIWEDLENGNTVSDGLLLRRYAKNVLPNVFVGLMSAGKSRCLILKVSSAVSFQFKDSDRLKDLRLEFRTNGNNIQNRILIIELLNKKFKDIFSIVCEDLIANIAHISDESLLTHQLYNRFEQWVLLFDLANNGGLPDLAQRGLYGEIFFIRKWLKNCNGDYFRVVKSWLGPEKAIKDFQLGDWAIEVKTSTGNNHQTIHISNERQLDTTSVSHLYLYHISLTKLQSSGETLNAAVDDVRHLLRNNLKELNIFNSQLVIAGYLDMQREQYEASGYSIRDENFYRVHNGFPRIEEADLRSGVGDVQYSIITSNCSEYLVSEEQLLKNINQL